MHQQSQLWGLTAVVVVGMVAGCSDSPLEPSDSKVLVRVDSATAVDCPRGGSVIVAGFDRNGDGTLDGSEISARTPVCNDDVAVVTRIVAELAGAHCAQGGSAVQTGPDRNGNGRLDDDEISHIDYVCNVPVPEVGVVTRIVDEPPGLHCAEGGTAVESGSDRNGNGQLDDDEISHVDFLCGDLVLTRFTFEPPGVNCVAGGVKIDVGHDRNASRVLDAGEVERSGFSCSDVLPGNVVIRSADDAAGLAHIHTIAGSLQVSSPLAELTLPDLAQITGALEVSHVESVTRISLPALTDAGSVSIDDDTALTTLELPMLRRVASIALRDLPALQSVPAFGQLTSTHDITIAGTGLPTLELNLGLPDNLVRVAITGNPMLTAVTVDDGAIGTLSIEDNPNLHGVAITVTRSTGDIVLVDPALDQLSITGEPLLPTNIAGSLTVSAPLTRWTSSSPLIFHGGLSLEATQLFKVDRVRTVHGKLRLVHNRRLRQGDTFLPEVRGGLEIVGNDVLNSVVLLGSAAQNGDVTVTDNPALTTMDALLLVAAVHGDVTIANNASLVDFPGPSAIDGRLTVENNPALSLLGMFDLANAGDIVIRNNGVLRDAFLSKLTSVATLEIASNPTLEALDLALLTQANEIHVDHNHALASCDVLAIFEHVTADVLEQSDNDDAKPCTRDIAPH